jgi:hypothetical protein
MDRNQKSNKTITPHQGGFFQDLTDRFRLISRLMVDSRVNPFLKILPIGTLVYALWPMDVPGPIDDVFVIWLGTTLFVQLCPPDVVEEHQRQLQARASGVQWNDYHSQSQNQDVIDGEYYENDPNNPRGTSSR